uniref:BD-FAE-like domain-containing protein n=1 Tax=Arcella intermedia TaxID=1963864 RepID=A0A6B2L7R5_9EUKA
MALYELVLAAVGLLGFLVVGYKWMIAVARLWSFAMVLLPAWGRPLRGYFGCGIVRNVYYGPEPGHPAPRGPASPGPLLYRITRNYLDLYLPYGGESKGNKKSPVAILVWGGAWTIGYKLWPFILAQSLAKHGVLCVVVDYRNFPQGNVDVMVEDIERAIFWVHANIGRYAGDTDNITLVGQSAGAHLTTLSVLRNAQRPPEDRYHVRKYVGISGAYNIVDLGPILDRHGLDQNLFMAIMGEDLKSHSPFHLLKEAALDTPALPLITLVHGTKDKTIGPQFTMDFVEELRRKKIHVDWKLFSGKSHTDFFLEDMIEGVGDNFVNYLLEIITEKPHDGPIKGQGFVSHSFFVNIARLVNPF